MGRHSQLVPYEAAFSTRSRESNIGLQAEDDALVSPMGCNVSSHPPCLRSRYYSVEGGTYNQNHHCDSFTFQMKPFALTSRRDRDAISAVRRQKHTQQQAALQQKLYYFVVLETSYTGHCTSKSSIYHVLGFSALPSTGLLLVFIGSLAHVSALPNPHAGSSSG